MNHSGMISSIVKKPTTLNNEEAIMLLYYPSPICSLPKYILEPTMCQKILASWDTLVKKMDKSPCTCEVYNPTVRDNQ